MSHQPVPPIVILRSFLTVASGFALALISLLGIMWGLGHAFFPEFIEFLNLDETAQQNILANDPTVAIPTTMLWSVVVLNAIACFGIGWYVIRAAPFAHFFHGVILTVLMFVTYLQMAISNPPAQKTMSLIFMVVFPLATFLGAKWTYSRLTLAHDATDMDGSNES